jgi:hypothetical protein
MMDKLLRKFDSEPSRVIPYLLYIIIAGGKFERPVVRTDDDLLGYGHYPPHSGFAHSNHSFDEQAISF